MWASLGRELGTTSTDLIAVVISAIAVYVAVIAATRIVGLRSFSKLSAFDFAMTVAIGSIVASVGTSSVALVDGLIAVAVLFAAQFSVAWLRRRTNLVGVVDNRPLLLMHGETVLEDHLDRARITLDDLRGRLRQANVRDLATVQAVVLETTGDISVLAGDPGTGLDPALLEGVIGAELVNRRDG